MSRVEPAPGLRGCALVAHALALGEIKRDAPLRGAWARLPRAPNRLLGLPRAEGFAERRGCAAVLGDEQDAARVAVEPMHKDGPIVALGEGGEHSVDVPRGARAALHGEAEGLVEDEHVGVLVERHLAQRARILWVGPEAAGAAGASRLSGGMRIVCPSSRRVEVSTRLPSTRTSPLRQIFARCGARAPARAA